MSTVKTLQLLQPYFGHLSCMPVVYVTRDASNLNQSPFSVIEKLLLFFFVKLGSPCRKPSYLATLLIFLP